VISENDRLLKGCELLKRADIESFGTLMYQTHDGLSKEYAVSCEELDFLVSNVKSIQGVAGARMMGGGFGGCTINLVEQEVVAEFSNKVSSAYQQQFNKTPEIYITQIEEGAHRIASNL